MNRGFMVKRARKSLQAGGWRQAGSRHHTDPPARAWLAGIPVLLGQLGVLIWGLPGTVVVHLHPRLAGLRRGCLALLPVTGEVRTGRGHPGTPSTAPTPEGCQPYLFSRTSESRLLASGSGRGHATWVTEQGNGDASVGTTTPGGHRDVPGDPVMPDHPLSGRDLPAGGPQGSGVRPLPAACPSAGSGHRRRCLWTPAPSLCPAGAPQSSCLPAAALSRLWYAAHGWPHPPGTLQPPLAALQHAWNCLVLPGMVGNPGWLHPTGWHGAERGQEAAALCSPVSWCQGTPWGVGGLWGKHRGHHRLPWGTRRAVGTTQS